MDKEELKQIYASIHTLRMEGDGAKLRGAVQTVISIHTLRVEGDFMSNVLNVIDSDISIHTLRMEGDMLIDPNDLDTKRFQSTPSAWRVTSR